jgi:hypothetical protein
MRKQVRTIKGIIVAAEWRAGGRITAVDVAGYDEMSYRVADDSVGRQLLGMLKKRIVAEGVVQTLDNKNTIKVNQFRIDTTDPLQTGDDGNGPAVL